MLKKYTKPADKELEVSGLKCKNILFKGVPGTGKSLIVDEIIRNKLHLGSKPQNVKRISIHSASSNADLMQGIGISAKDTFIEYKEKQGLIMQHILDACFNPGENFVLVLEEIQENSLNELIGDLIYLVEPEKRASIRKIGMIDEREYDEQDLIDLYIRNDPAMHYIEIPNLVNGELRNRKMILPENLFIFCTSNYRDDKKVIEDNLLRRFDVIEVYPHYDDFKSKSVAIFLKELNMCIVKICSREIHPDRFQIGHASWINIEEGDEEAFYSSLLKVVIEFKEIKEISYESGLEKIFKQINLEQLHEKDWIRTAFEKVFNKKSYQELINVLQTEVYGDILSLTKSRKEPIESNQDKNGDEAKQATLL